MWIRSLIGDVLHAMWYNQKKKKRKNLSSGFYGLGFPCDSTGKESPRMWETWVLSLGWEDPLEKRKATHSSILAWRIPWTV